MTSTYAPKDSKNNSNRPLGRRDIVNPTSVSSFEPPTELREGDYSFSVYVDLPGMRAQEINITTCPTSVTVQGQRRSPHTANQVLESDLLSGQFERVIQLPQPILGEQVYAEYSQGVLRLELPKHLCADNPENLPTTCQSMTL